MKDLSQRFQRIKREFFPRWDKNNQWRIRQDKRYKRPGYAECQAERKTIKVNLYKLDNLNRNISEDDVDQLIIHEICHAVVNQYHGPNFYKRIKEVRLHAESIGRRSLAELILKDEDRSRNRLIGKNLHASICEQIYDWTSQTTTEGKDISYGDMMRIVAEDFFFNLKEFQQLRGYKVGTFRKMYEQGRRIGLLDRTQPPKRRKE